MSDVALSAESGESVCLSFDLLCVVYVLLYPIVLVLLGSWLAETV